MKTVGETEPLKILEKTSKKVGDDYVKDLFDNDFNFDKNMCFLVGRFTGEVISSNTNLAHLQEIFNKELNRTMTHIKTSKGMRSSKGEFFGKKGHDVVFSQMETLKIRDFLTNPPKTRSEYIKKEADMHKSIKEYIQENPELVLEFDMKDKQQKKGSREIYVMTDLTKSIQQPLENFFKELCVNVPNELINKRSHVRPKLVHSKMFEYREDNEGNNQTLYCTLDCRKWAPRSNLWKYYFFIMGMADFLPVNFVNYFEHVWLLMFNKKIRIQSRYVDLLKKNPSTNQLTHYLNIRGDQDYELTMPYSFMMGIFNYLSSLMHAGSQLYFSDIALRKFGAFVNMFAHSDDSGGTVTSKSQTTNLIVFKKYEIFQKSMNHLFSTKKCCLSLKNFEIVSIMYIHSRYIPMTHKFMSNMQVNPRGKGWGNDITKSISFVIELHLNGCSLLNCYASMLACNELHRKAYHIPQSKMLSKVPLVFGGVPDMHPLHLILLGSDCQELMLDLIETPEVRAHRIRTYTILSGDYIIGKGNTLNYQLPYHVRHELRMELNEDERKLLKSFSTIASESTLSHCLQYMDSLFNNDFVYTLKNVDTNQLFLSTLFSNCKIVYQTNLYDIKDLVQGYIAMTSCTDEITPEVSAFALSKVNQYSQNMPYLFASENIYVPFETFNKQVDKTCKPITYNTIQPIGLSIPMQTLKEVLAILTDERSSVAIGDLNRVQSVLNYTLSCFGGAAEDLHKVLDKYLMDDFEKVRTAYLYFPSSMNVDTIERLWTYLLFYTTKSKYVSSRKPQFFTATSFKQSGACEELMKHNSLIIKFIMSKQLGKDELTQLHKNLYQCDCRKPDEFDNNIDSTIKMLLGPDGNYSIQNSFAIYHETQKKGKNVWYGPADFTIYTPFGNVKHINFESQILTEFTVQDSLYLGKLYKYYEMFCKTRSINTESPAYSVPTGVDLKLAFNDINTVICVQPMTPCVMLTNSKVFIKRLHNPVIHKFGRDLRCDGEPVDLTIYNIYDFNEEFYNTHNIKNIKKILFSENLLASKTKILENFETTKIYQCLLTDESNLVHRKFEQKYSNSGMLGTDCSFTKSLFCATEKGLTNYRSSANPILSDPSYLENYTIQNVPVLDAISKVTLSRLNFRESESIQKLINDEEMTYQDKINVERVVDKLGLEATATSMIIYSRIFQNMNYGMVKEIPHNILESALYNVIKTIIECVSDDKVGGKFVYNENSKLMCQHILELYWCEYRSKFSCFMLGYLLTKCLYRARRDRVKLQYDIMRDNNLTAAMRLTEENFIYIHGMITAMLDSLKANGIDINETIFQKFRKFVRIKRMKYNDEDITMTQWLDDNSEDLNEILEEAELDVEELTKFCSEMFTIPQPKIVAKNEFCWDALLNDTELDEDILEDEDSYEIREYLAESPTLEVKLTSLHELKLFYIASCLKDYSYIKVKTHLNDFNAPWLGETNKSKEDGWYIYEYPGASEQSKPVTKFDAQLIHRKEYVDIFKDVTEDLDYEVKNRIEHFKEKLRQLGVVNNNIINTLLKDDDHFNLASINFFEKLGIDDKYMKNVFRKRRAKQRTLKNFLPGFSGLLSDPHLVAELKSLFGENYNNLLSGSVKLTKSTYNNLISNFKRITKLGTISDRRLITFLSSLLLDCVVTNNSDSWFLDSCNELIEPILSRVDADFNEVSLSIFKEEETANYSVNDEIYTIKDEYGF